MSHIQTLLDDVLSGRRVIHDPATFRLLRQFAPDKTGELDELEAQTGKTQINAATATENTMPKPRNTIHLTRNDLEGILHHGQSATIDEVEWLLSHANDPRLMLSYTEEAELRNVATRLLADRHITEARAGNNEFIARNLNTFATPYGDLSRTEVARLEQIRLKAIQAVKSCTDHQRQRCVCWKDAREALFEIRRAAGEKSAFGMAALAVWNAIEEFARKRTEPKNNQPSEPPPGIMYNWRAYKCPEYMASLQQQSITPSQTGDNDDERSHCYASTTCP
jgi:hypothetical protein